MTKRPAKACTHERVSLKVEFVSGKDVEGGSLARAKTTCTQCRTVLKNTERRGITLDALLQEIAR